MLMLAVMLAACENDDAEKFKIMTKKIELIVGESQKIETSGGFTARSTDEQVATVAADGTITAVSAGEADVVFTSTEDATQHETCHVTADWRYHYFEEPVIDFSLSLEQVKAMETHKYQSDNEWEPGPDILNAPNPWLIRYNYEEQSIPMEICYGILDKENGGIGEIVMTAPSLRGFTQSQKEEIIQQLTERYGSPNMFNNDILFTPLSKKYTVMIRNNYIIYRPK